MNTTEREECANCKGVLGYLAEGRDPEELCDTCYSHSQETVLATAGMTIHTNRTDRLAELVANGMEVAEAGRAMELTKSQTMGIWHRLKRSLGAQAS